MTTEIHMEHVKQLEQLNVTLISAVEAARVGGRSERTIRRWIARGLLPARRTASNRLEIRLTDLYTLTGAGALIGRGTCSQVTATLVMRVVRLEARITYLERLLQVAAPSDALGSV